METPTATSLADRIRYALASPMASDDILDPHKELAEVLKTVGLEPSSSGGTIIFHGKDPILKSPCPLATTASVGLMAKAVAGYANWGCQQGRRSAVVQGRPPAARGSIDCSRATSSARKHYGRALPAD